jgi:hypothetical protein
MRWLVVGVASLALIGWFLLEALGACGWNEGR